MSHADVRVCDGDQQQEAGPSFPKYGMLRLCRSVSNITISRSTGRWYGLDVELVI